MGQSLARVLSVATLLAVATAASASTLSFDATLSAATEHPPGVSPATGFATLALDTTLNTLAVNVSFAGLTADPTAILVHCCAPPTTNAAVALFLVGFPAATGGSFAETIDLTLPGSYTASFLTLGGGTPAGAESTLITALSAGEGYLNIHDAVFPGGEIRGNFSAAAVPEPATLVLLSLGFAGLGLTRTRRRR